MKTDQQIHGAPEADHGQLVPGGFHGIHPAAEVLLEAPLALLVPEPRTG